MQDDNFKVNIVSELDKEIINSLGLHAKFYETYVCTSDITHRKMSAQMSWVGFKADNFSSNYFEALRGILWLWLEYNMGLWTFESFDHSLNSSKVFFYRNLHKRRLNCLLIKAVCSEVIFTCKLSLYRNSNNTPAGSSHRLRVWSLWNYEVRSGCVWINDRFRMRKFNHFLLHLIWNLHI